MNDSEGKNSCIILPQVSNALLRKDDTADSIVSSNARSRRRNSAYNDRFMALDKSRDLVSGMTRPSIETIQ